MILKEHVNYNTEGLNLEISPTKYICFSRINCKKKLGKAQFTSTSKLIIIKKKDNRNCRANLVDPSLLFSNCRHIISCYQDNLQFTLNLL